jgi:osmoprotectant transport system permease protein
VRSRFGIARRWLLFALAAVAFLVIVANTQWWQASLGYLFPGQTVVMHPRAPLIVLVWEHVQLVALSSIVTILLGVSLGIWVTRPSGRDFLPMTNTITSLGQTFPPVAVLALAVPVLGFGAVPTVAALFLYGLLPVVRNTTAGMRSVPMEALDAARGTGMSRWQVLRRIEIPLSLPVILAGIRISVVANIGTAMIGAVIGAGGLGSPIIAGLARDNLALVVEGAVPAAMLALLADQFIANLERSLLSSGTADMARRPAS